MCPGKTRVVYSWVLFNGLVLVKLQVKQYMMTTGILTIVLLQQIFSNEGEFKSRFGVRGRSPGQLQRPTGVAVHPSGDIIIADYDNKWVSIFSSDGKYKVGFSSYRTKYWLTLEL